MSMRHDPDQLITAWVANSIGIGGPDYLSEVLAVVERTPQHRWARWFPGGWTVTPAKAPMMRTGMLLAAAALLLLALISAAVVAGAFRRPTLALQGVVAVPGSSGVIFASASDDAVWATAADSVLAIDPATGNTTRYQVPGGVTLLTGVVARPDAIWVADYDGNRVVRLDRSTRQVTAEVFVSQPVGLGWQNGLWAQMNDGGGALRIDPATAKIDLMLPDAISYAVAPGALWYVAVSGGDAWAVEVDPATGAERRRVPVPASAAASITIDAGGNPWVFTRPFTGTTTTVVTVDAATGVAGTPFELAYNLAGGIARIGDSMWALPGLDTAGGSRLVELGANGPTGRVESLQDGLDPDGAVVAFGSIWIPWDNRASLYRYPVDALAR